MVFDPVSHVEPQGGYEVLPGGRIARMSALETASDRSMHHAVAPRRNGQGYSSSSEFADTPDSRVHTGRGGPLHAHPPTGRRTGSLSSGSRPRDDPTSPISGSGGDHSSPPGPASQQSEQLPSFKDYYSTDEIHPGDKVATLWAYQPRAADEFELERGDMLKIVGIWDDGWATGVRLPETMDSWEAKRKVHRDSGVSNGSEDRGTTPPLAGEIKAFPLVCVCLPQHWKKNIDGDGSTETDSSGGLPVQRNR
ncbi:MAG: hypothetical protein M1826_002060 [Phylliscum demangeonii]|nr:MAG: hypothetical protein M1826_002060 [Phylliscum demangeonii]